MKQRDLLAKLQICGIDICRASLSKLERRLRAVTDRELVGLAEVFGTTVDELLNG